MGKFVVFDIFDVIFATIDFIHTLGVLINAQDFETDFGLFHRKR